MRKLTLICSLVLMASLLAVTPARADAISTAFLENGVNYDSLQVFVFGADFSGTGISGVTPGVWTPVLNNLHWATATDGNLLTNSETFNVSFNSTTASPYLDMYAFNNTTLVDTARFQFNATGLASNTPVYTETNQSGITTYAGHYQTDVDQSGQESINSAAVPEPATFALIGTGLIGLGLLRRKPRKTAEK